MYLKHRGIPTPARDEESPRWWDRGRPIKTASRPEPPELDDDPDPEPDAIPEFSPAKETANDLEWFFRLGPKPRSLTPKQRRRYGHIERCLDGRGARIRQYYANPNGFLDRRLAGLLDHDEIPVSDLNLLKDLDERAAHGTIGDQRWKFDLCLGHAVFALNAELMRYIEHENAHYGARREKHIVMTESALLRAIAAGGRLVRARHRLGSKPYRYVDGDGEIVEDHDHEDLLPKDLVRQLVRENALDVSTWGDWRVSEDAAGRILQDYNLPADRAFELLRERSQIPLPITKRHARDLSPHESPDDSEDRAFIAENYADDLYRERLRGPTDREVPFDLSWDRKLLENRVGDPTTTVRELAKKYKLNSSVVRALLIEHGCQEAEIQNTAIPVAWLHSEAGSRFRRAVGAAARAGFPSGRSEG